MLMLQSSDQFAAASDRPVRIPEAKFLSKELLERWTQVKLDLGSSEQRIQVLKEFSEVILDLERATDKQNFYLRVDYYATTVRYLST